MMFLNRLVRHRRQDRWEFSKHLKRFPRASGPRHLNPPIRFRSPRSCIEALDKKAGNSGRRVAGILNPTSPGGLVVRWFPVWRLFVFAFQIYASRPLLGIDTYTFDCHRGGEAFKVVVDRESLDRYDEQVNAGQPLTYRTPRLSLLVLPRVRIALEKEGLPPDKIIHLWPEDFA
jgi:hypothetical protein